jgi:solute carrier family 25 phosphate transporter 3
MLFPSQNALQVSIAPGTPIPSSTPSKSVTQTKRPLFTAWSAVDDVKSKANQLSTEAEAEYKKAAAAVQTKAGKIEMYSPKFYAACTLGGLLACGVTHTAVTPLDLVKCRRQVDSKLYRGNIEAWGKIARAEGVRGIFTGWSPTFFGYSGKLPRTANSWCDVC